MGEKADSSLLEGSLNLVRRSVKSFILSHEEKEKRELGKEFDRLAHMLELVSLGFESVNWENLRLAQAIHGISATLFDAVDETERARRARSRAGKIETALSYGSTRELEDLLEGEVPTDGEIEELEKKIVKDIDLELEIQIRTDLEKEGKANRSSGRQEDQTDGSGNKPRTRWLERLQALAGAAVFAVLLNKTIDALYYKYNSPSQANSYQSYNHQGNGAEPTERSYTIKTGSHEETTFIQLTWGDGTKLTIWGDHSSGTCVPKTTAPEVAESRLSKSALKKEFEEVCRSLPETPSARIKTRQ